MTQVAVNVITETGRVTFHKSRTSIKKVMSKINEIGFIATIKNQVAHQIAKSDELASLKMEGRPIEKVYQTHQHHITPFN